jgi:hypothetical protein
MGIPFVMRVLSRLFGWRGTGGGNKRLAGPGYALLQIHLGCFDSYRILLWWWLSELLLIDVLFSNSDLVFRSQRPTRACALFDYEGEEREDLAFRRGDVITLLERRSEGRRLILPSQSSIVCAFLSVSPRAFLSLISRWQVGSWAS